MNFVIMGIDRIGKNTFIETCLPGYKEIHLTKPPAGVDPLMYSKAEYMEYFMTLKKSDGIVYNRGHIDEFIYAPRYRHYPTYWLTIMEEEMADEVKNTIFVLLYTTDFSFIKDDGLSLDFSRMGEEQEDFHKYFDRSKMYNKIKIQVNDGNNYRNKLDIKEEFERKVKELCSSI